MKLDRNYVANSLDIETHLDEKGNLVIGSPLAVRYGAGDIISIGSEITELPDNLIVYGWLDLHNSGITKLPKGLIIYGDLSLNDLITEIPKDITIYGSLDLYANSSIKELPDNLSLGRNLRLFHSAVCKLPENLKVGRDLDLRDTCICDMPLNITVGRYIKGMPKGYYRRGKDGKCYKRRN